MNYLDIDKSFFGREEVLETLNRRLRDLKEGYRQNVALLGNPYLGKSSILYHFVENVDDDEVIVIYLDLQNKDDEYLFNKFIGSLLYNYARNKGLPTHDEIPLLLEELKEVIPHTVSVIHKIRNDHAAGKTSASFQGLLALPEVFTNETGKYCALIFDEFQTLQEYKISNAFQLLGKKIMTQKRCFYCMASSYPQEARKIISEKLSLLFGNFEMVDIESFDLKNSQRFIAQRLSSLKMGAGLSSFLTDFTGGHPLYLDLICREMINLSAIHKQREVYMPLLAQAVENTIFDRWGVLSRHFELLINDLFTGKGNRIISHLLISLANGHHKLEDIAGDIGKRKPYLSKKMNDLIAKGIVMKNGKFYYFSDKLFKYWVKYVYQKRLRDVELSPNKQRRMFKEEFQLHVEAFKISSRKDLSSRIVELLHCFDNESLHLNGRKYRLPIFKEIVPFKTRNEQGIYFDLIKASTDDADWFIVMKKDNLAEHELNDILKESRKIAQKPGQCLIISLSGLDENTRIKALQERFWIWNEEELKVLLTLFDQPFIVR